MRTDVHTPTNLVTEDYEFLACGDNNHDALRGDIIPTFGIDPILYRHLCDTDRGDIVRLTATWEPAEPGGNFAFGKRPSKATNLTYEEIEND